MPCKLVSAGWKEVSLVDIVGHVSFTLWLCGCNLKCPFCHNWRVAEAMKPPCREIDVSSILEAVSSSKPLIDYLHVTGGEPLLQHEQLEVLLREVGRLGVQRSIDTNLTLETPLRRLVEKKLVEHIAFDIKAPYRELYGVDKTSADKLWKSFLNNVAYLSRSNDIVLEVRIPVSRFSISLVEKDLSAVADILDSGRANYYVVLFPLLSEPCVSPRDKEWSKKYCSPSRTEIEKVRRIVDELFSTARKVYVKLWKRDQ